MRKDDNKIKGVSMSSIELTSVGSTLTSDLIVYPTDCSEAPETASDADEMMGVHIYDLDNEWFNNLSATDLKAFFNFLVKVNSDNMVMSIFNQWKSQIWGEWEEANNCFMNLELDTVGVA
tara:strand:- start:86 stop:445 length:360 start_codon:yes stop_codon:yes gene_type:complete